MFIYEYLVYTVDLIAASRFGSKLVMKGGTALMSMLVECGRKELMRNTTDIDIHCNHKDVWVDFYSNIESILNNNDSGFVYKVTRRRSASKGLTDSDSLTICLNDNGNVLNFGIDMNIKPNSIISVTYSTILQMPTYDTYTMASDKIAVISSKKVYRRIKDLYDLTVLFSIYNFSYMELCNRIVLKHNGVKLENMLMQNNYLELEHAYSKFSGIINKPDFRDLIAYCRVIMEPFYRKVRGNLKWDTEGTQWIIC